MRMMTKVASVIVAFAAASASAADVYPIRLSHVAKVGEVSSVVVKAKFSRTKKWTAGNDAGKTVEEAVDCTLKGKQTIDAVSKNGRPTKRTILVSECTNEGAQLIAPETTLTAENVDGATVFKIGGEDPSESVRRVLFEVVSTSRPDEPTMDEQMGTEEPRKVGQTWPVHGEYLAKATHLPFPVSGDEFKGLAELTEVSQIDGKLFEMVKIKDSCVFENRTGSTGTIYKNLKMNAEMICQGPVDSDVDQDHVHLTRVVSETVVDSKGSCDVHSDYTYDVTYNMKSK